MRTVHSLVAATLAAMCGVWSPAAVAQNYPSRLVHLVVPQAPGGATDTFARAIGRLLGRLAADKRVIAAS